MSTGPDPEAAEAPVPATASTQAAPSRFKLLYPFDIPLIVYALSAFIASLVWDFTITWSIMWNVSVDVAIVTSFWTYVAIFVLIDYHRRRFKHDHSFDEVKRDYLRIGKGWVLDWRMWYELFRMVFAFKVCMVLYTNLKTQIPHINPVLYDDAFRRLDQTLHFGVDLAVAVPGSFLSAAPLAWTIDQLYVGWYPIKIAVLVFMIFFADRKTCWQFFTCYILVWAICGTLAILAPTLGPCYAYPELTAGLNTAHAHELQAGLLEAYEWTKAHPSELRTYEGIAAFPSLHVGMAVLYTCFFWPWRRVFVCFAVFAVITELGSVFLGWHYAVDGYVSGAIAVAVFFATRPFFREPPPEPPPAIHDQSADPAPGSAPPTTH